MATASPQPSPATDREVLRRELLARIVRSEATRRDQRRAPEK